MVRTVRKIGRKNMEIKQMLDHDQLKFLRERGLITEYEYAYIAGDLVVAENVTTAEKKVLGKVTELLHENKKRVLLG